MSPALLQTPDGYDATRHAAHASRVLRYLLTTYPNQVVAHRDVCEVLGYEVTPQATSNAATRLRAGAFGLNIVARAGKGGGYVLQVPVPAAGRQRCATCAACSLIGTCKRLKGRPVEPGEWCWSWSCA